MFSLRNWRTRHLVLASGSYWLALALATLGEPVYRFWRLTRLPANTGDAAVQLGNGGIQASISHAGATVWSGSTSFLTLALIVAVPPLLLWIAWLKSRPHQPVPLDNRTSQRADDGSLLLRDGDGLPVSPRSNDKSRAPLP